MADRVFDLLALPENIRSLINIGTATSKRIRLIQHAPETSERLKSLGFDIYHAQLYLQLEELNLLLEKEDSVEYRILAAKHTKKLSDLTTEAEQTLNKCFDGAEVRKLQLGIFAEDINEILKRYGRALSDFQAFMSALYIQQQLKSSKDSEKLLLERDRFAVHRRYETATKFYLDHSGCVRRAKGELIDTRDKPPQELHLLLERHDYEKESHAEEEEETNCSDTRLPVKKLAKILRAFNPQADGVLECLGYRTQPTIDLVFRIPDEMSEHGLENLQNLIANNNHGCGMSVEQRIRIAHQIAAAIGSVHCSKLFHKSLRPETVLLFSEGHQGSQGSGARTTFRTYLSSWSLLREEDGLSYKIGTNDWTRNIYRHPDRQNLHPEKRYTPGHDIYSLGVTLLELGIWDSLIVWSDRSPRLSLTYLKAAKEAGVIQSDDYDSNLKELLRPIKAKRTIIHLVSSLEDRMGPVGKAYSRVVSTCLGWNEDLRGCSVTNEDPVKGADKFQEQVAGPLFELQSSI